MLYTGQFNIIQINQEKTVSCKIILIYGQFKGDHSTSKENGKCWTFVLVFMFFFGTYWVQKPEIEVNKKKII